MLYEIIYPSLQQGAVVVSRSKFCNIKTVLYAVPLLRLFVGWTYRNKLVCQLFFPCQPAQSPFSAWRHCVFACMSLCEKRPGVALPSSQVKGSIVALTTSGMLHGTLILLKAVRAGWDFYLLASLFSLNEDTLLQGWASPMLGRH